MTAGVVHENNPCVLSPGTINDTSIHYTVDTNQSCVYQGSEESRTRFIIVKLVDNIETIVTSRTIACENRFTVEQTFGLEDSEVLVEVLDVNTASIKMFNKGNLAHCQIL